MSASTASSKGSGRTIAIVVVVVVIVAAIGGFYLYSGMGSRSSSSSSSTVTVSIPNGTGSNQALTFSPQSLNVAAGTTIKFVNNDNTLHTVTFTSAPAGVSLSSISDANLAAGATFTITLTTPGTYQYHCTIHTYMTGTITVA